MKNFEIGDKVKLKKNNDTYGCTHPWVKLDKTYIVDELCVGNTIFATSIDFGNTKKQLHLYVRCFELVTEEDTTREYLKVMREHERLLEI